MKFELYKDVALAVNIPEHRLQKGDIAKVVEYLPRHQIRNRDMRWKFLTLSASRLMC